MPESEVQNANASLLITVTEVGSFTEVNALHSLNILPSITVSPVQADKSAFFS